jgi:hypothetical protein
MDLGLADQTIRRYARQILLDEVGGRGQRRLCAARVAVLGRGRAAEVCAAYLAAAGVRGLVTEAATERARAIRPDLEIAASGPADLVVAPADPEVEGGAAAAAAWVEGALAAVAALRALVLGGQDRSVVRGARLEVP